MIYSINIPKEYEILIGKNWLKIIDNENINFFIKKKNLSTFLCFMHNKLYILNKKHISLTILYKIKNLIYGLKFKYTFKLHLVGLGYRINIEKDNLQIKLGYSHLINFPLPKGCFMIHPNSKGPIYVLVGNKYDVLKQTALSLKKLKKIDPYKGKGIRYFYDTLYYKEGKRNNN